MSKTTYPRSEGARIVKGTWEAIRRRKDVHSDDSLMSDERYSYDMADDETKKGFDRLASQELLMPPDCLRFNIWKIHDNSEQYPGQQALSLYVATGYADYLDDDICDIFNEYSDASNIETFRELWGSKEKLNEILKTFHGRVEILYLHPRQVLYRTIGLIADKDLVKNGCITNKILGEYWQSENPNLYKNIDDWRANAAVFAEWNGDYGHVKIRLKKGLLSLRGTVSQQAISKNGNYVLPGGGNQYYIPNITQSSISNQIEGVRLRDVILPTNFKNSLQMH